MIDREEVSARKRVATLDTPMPLKKRLLGKQPGPPLCAEAASGASDKPLDTSDNEDVDDLAILLQGSAQGKAQQAREEDDLKPRLSLASAVSADACTADDSSSSSSSSEDAEEEAERGNGEAEGVEEGEAAHDAADEEEEKIEMELSKLFDDDCADAQDEIEFMGDEVFEDGYEAVDKEEGTGDSQIQFVGEDLIAGDEKDEDLDGPCASEAENGLAEDQEEAGEEGQEAKDADSDAESDASSSSSSSSAAPDAISDGSSLLELIAKAGGDLAVPTAQGSGPSSATEKALELKLLQDLRQLPGTGLRRAARFRQLSQWARGKAAADGFKGAMTCAQLEALLSRVSRQLGGLPVPPAAISPKGAQGSSQRLRPSNSQAGSGGAKQQPAGAVQASVGGSDGRSRPGFAVPAHRELPPPGRSSLSGGGRRTAGSGGGARGTRGALRFQDKGLLVQVFSIVNHRDDNLWFENPGQQVSCNWCGDEFAQVCGSLQGAEGRSQFSQDQFVCHGCLQGEIEPQDEDE